MKKVNRPSQTKAATAEPRRFIWWPWAVGVLALLLVFQVYAPALNGGFVWDDLSLPFFAPDITPDIGRFVRDLRPLLMLSFWVDFRLAPDQTTAQTSGQPEVVRAFAEQFHSTNVILHTLVSTLVALIIFKLLEWAGVTVRLRAAIAVLSGAVFLLHPLQTESVAYVASRSEVLSVLFYYAAFTVFLYRRDESITLWRSLAILALFGAAIAVKEHTLTLPALLLLTDYFWGRGGLRKNRILYGLIAVAGAVGVVFVVRVLSSANTAGFRMRGMTPLDFFYTQCRVIWIYLRMFFLPFGQNIDPDVRVSHSLFEHGAIFGLIALIALVAAAWIYRKRFPLASFGILVFLLLIAPTASIVPIRDPLAEHRLYLPFLGLLLICAEFLRRLNFQRVILVGVAVLAVCSVLTYQRNRVWSSSLSLWQDSVNKAPDKYRPRFQLAYAEFKDGRCSDAVANYEAAARIGPVRDDLLIDWGEALGCANRWYDALKKYQDAARLSNTAHIHTEVAVAYANLRQFDFALDELGQAEKIDPGFWKTYALRGQIYEYRADHPDAAREYKHACALNPRDNTACQGAVRMSR
jgi:tetratricopeptide (TPR) repeat protein